MSFPGMAPGMGAGAGAQAGMSEEQAKEQQMIKYVSFFFGFLLYHSLAKSKRGVEARRQEADVESEKAEKRRLKGSSEDKEVHGNKRRGRGVAPGDGQKRREKEKEEKFLVEGCDGKGDDKMDSRSGSKELNGAWILGIIWHEEHGQDQLPGCGKRWRIINSWRSMRVTQIYQDLTMGLDRKC